MSLKLYTKKGFHASSGCLMQVGQLTGTWECGWKLGTMAVERDFCRTEKRVGWRLMILRQVLRRIVHRGQSSYWSSLSLEGIAGIYEVELLSSVSSELVEPGHSLLRGSSSAGYSAGSAPSLLPHSLLTGSRWNQGHWVV